MVLFTDLARAKFAQMEKKAAIAREAQDKVNQLDAQIAELNKEGDKATLSESMKNDMKQNNISLDGKEAKDLSGELNKGEMMKLRAKYESISASAADFVQQNQLKLQQLMQNFNTTITMINSLLSMSAQSNMEIAKSIR
ncbi:type III secretion effector SseB [bacterium endosymbiont of Mortierella elongata FMR23-6]|nr:type III secretion effector SseB [bacterium endosymbiont of Mortierella elongata FMR23-6]